jgi:hypothetical protein
MNIWFVLAAALALLTSLLHALGGGRSIVRPLRRGADPHRFAVIDAVWHMITWHLAVTAIALIVMAFRPIDLLADLLIVQWMGYVVAFLALSVGRFKRLLALPQWTLFLALSAITAAGAHPWPASPGAAAWAAMLSGAILAGIAALHVYWALGGLWPGHDRASLASTVIGGPASTRLPSPAATLLVALALACSAALVLRAGGWISVAALPQPLARAGGWIVAGVLLLRGVGGLFEVFLRSSIGGTPYAYWNRVLYSPLCLGLSAVVTLALVG